MYTVYSWIHPGYVQDISRLDAGSDQLDEIFNSMAQPQNKYLTICYFPLQIQYLPIFYGWEEIEVTTFVVWVWCLLGITTCCDLCLWLAELTHWVPVDQSQAEVAAKVDTKLKHKILWYVKLGHQRNYQGWAAKRHYANQTASPLWPLKIWEQFWRCPVSGGGEPARGAHSGQHLHRHRPVRVREQRPQISPGERGQAGQGCVF